MVRRYGKDARRQRDAAWQGRVTHGRKGAAVRRCKVPVPLQMWCRVAYVQGSVHTVTFCRLACSDSLAAHLYECCYTAVAAVLQLIISCTLAGASFTNAVGQVSTSCSHTGTAAGSCRQPPPPLHQCSPAPSHHTSCAACYCFRFCCCCCRQLSASCQAQLTHRRAAHLSSASSASPPVAWPPLLPISA